MRDADSLRIALDRATQELGPIEVLEYSPLPQKEFLRPVLETTAADLEGAVEFSVYGPVTAVHQVLQGMRFLGRGTVLFVNGGSGRVRIRTSPAPRSPSPESPPTDGCCTTPWGGEHPRRSADHPRGDHPRTPTHDPGVLADTLWRMHTNRGDFRCLRGADGSVNPGEADRARRRRRLKATVELADSTTTHEPPLRRRLLSPVLTTATAVLAGCTVLTPTDASEGWRVTYERAS